MDDMCCTVEELPGASIVHVRGEVDLASAGTLREALVDVLGASPATHLIIDLNEVGFIDSTGIGVIVGAYRRATVNGGRLTTVASSTSVLRTLRTAGLLGPLRVMASIDDALDD